MTHPPASAHRCGGPCRTVRPLEMFGLWRLRGWLATDGTRRQYICRSCSSASAAASYHAKGAEDAKRHQAARANGVNEMGARTLADMVTIDVCGWRAPEAPDGSAYLERFKGHESFEDVPIGLIRT